MPYQSTDPRRRRPTRTAAWLAFGLLAYSTAAAAQPATTAQVPDYANAARELGRYLDRIAGYGFSGVVVVARGNDVLLSEGYGYADRARRIELTPDMPLHIGSVGKQFTAAAIMRLEMDGKLKTTDSLARFFPNAPADKRGLTVHQLLSHTAGFPYLPRRSMLDIRSRAEVMQEMLELPLQFNAERPYAYSSPGYTLLAGVVEAASGESYESYVRNKLFRPAGLQAATLAGDKDVWNKADVRFYLDDDERGEPLNVFAPMPGGTGAGSIAASALDLYRWDRALVNGKVLSRESRDKLFAPAVTVNPNMDYGYGWMLTTSAIGLGLVIHHPGDLGGFNAELRRYVRDDVVFVIASNARSGGRAYRDVVFAAWNALLSGRPLPTPPAVVAAGSAPSPLAGEYTVGDGAVVVRAVDDGLRVGAHGSAALALLSSGGPDDSKAQSLSERAVAVAAALAAGNDKPLLESLHSSLPAVPTAQSLLEQNRQVADSLGAFRGVENLGTAIISATSARSFMKLQFERGSYNVAYFWNGDRINGFDAEFDVPFETRFRPIGDDRLVSHDPFTGRSIELRCEGNGAGVCARIRISGPNPETTAVLDRKLR